MHHFHAVVWIDHKEARIFEFGPDDVEKFVVHAHHGHRQVHHKAGTLGSGHSKEDAHFLDEVAHALAHPKEILITGPGKAKTSLMKRLSEHHRNVAARVMGIESADHPTDGQIVAHARAYFEVKDKTTPQITR